jgi:glycosyltransferase involved in cell wall biosynthesis
MIVRDLVAAVSERGHEVDTVEIPFLSVWDEMLDQMLALRMIDVSEDADVLIAIRPPSYALEHPNKRLWFIHHHRGAYDLWGTEWQDIPSTPEGIGVRDAIRGSDDIYLREAKRIFTNSQIVADRLKKFNDLDGTVLYPPLGHPERFYHAPAEDFVFYPCRITSHKRQLLAVEAAVHLETDMRVVIAGAPDHPAQLAPLRDLIRERGLEQRVELIPRWISEEEKAELIARSGGVLYIPFDEDSYGYVTLEAFHSHKPVITCRDSGGTLEIIKNGVNGLVVEPDAVSLAKAIDTLRSNPDQASVMGESAYAVLQEKGINWDRVVDSLLG